MARRALGRGAREATSMRYLGIALVYTWRYTLGALFPTTCKYHPSCSQYAIDALRKHGLVKGSILAGWRLLRCNPWSHGGVDYA
jgi:uncharacterized protein